MSYDPHKTFDENFPSASTAIYVALILIFVIYFGAKLI